MKHVPMLLALLAICATAHLESLGAGATDDGHETNVPGTVKRDGKRVRITLDGPN